MASASDTHPAGRTIDWHRAHVAAWIAAQGARLQPDRAEAERFLNLLEPQGGPQAFRTFSETPYTRLPGSDPLEHALLGTLDECWDRLLRLHILGASIAVTLNAVDGSGRGPNNICRIRALYADVDHRLGDWPSTLPLPHIQVQSSPGRLHLYWLVNGLALTEFPRVQATIIERLEADPRASAINQAMRLPGFWHRKNPRQPHQARITKTLSEPPYRADWLMDALSIRAAIARPTR